MTDNLTLLGDVGLSRQELADLQRQAGIRLAGAALKAARGDEKAAAGMLRVALEAIGALPYEAGQGRYQWGQAT